MIQRVSAVKRISGQIKVPGDKSISHRAVMFGGIAAGRTEIDGFLMGKDCLSTVSCMKALGVEIDILQPGHLIITGQGLDGLKEPTGVLDCGNSGTTMRLLMGILSGQPFHAVLTGDQSLSGRPMGRVALPLKQMGAKIDGRQDGTKAPLSIRGGKLNPIDYSSPVASAQVKSAVLLAGLFTPGYTSVVEPERSRDHTERMLSAFGADIKVDQQKVTVTGLPQLTGQKISVPGDISSAAFFMVAASIIPGSSVTLLNVGINPSRTGIIDVLTRMGGKITYQNDRVVAGEPVADITVESSALKGVIVQGEDIPRLIDEIPVLTVAAAFAEGVTVIKDAHELKVKESNRIDTVVSQMKKLSMMIEATDDGMVITGTQQLFGTEVDSHDDHRIAMALAVAGIAAQGETVIHHAECVDISFPGFFEILANQGGQNA